MIADIDAPEPAQETINACLAAHANDVDGIVITAWVPAVTASYALRKIGDKRIKMVAIDHDQVMLQAVEDGFRGRSPLSSVLSVGYDRFVADLFTWRGVLGGAAGQRKQASQDMSGSRSGPGRYSAPTGSVQPAAAMRGST